mmetsp:Transcript_2986/g.12214  ORF Transcript_2986/g.12214 Transcript_2986/m.12214 type:complete len:204 (-) Transcript_2986:5049-5660(-)
MPPNSVSLAKAARAGEWRATVAESANDVTGEPPSEDPGSQHASIHDCPLRCVAQTRGGVGGAGGPVTTCSDDADQGPGPAPFDARMRSSKAACACNPTSSAVHSRGAAWLAASAARAVAGECHATATRWHCTADELKSTDVACCWCCWTGEEDEDEDEGELRLASTPCEAFVETTCTSKLSGADADPVSSGGRHLSCSAGPER